MMIWSVAKDLKSRVDDWLDRRTSDEARSSTKDTAKRRPGRGKPATQDNDGNVDMQVKMSDASGTVTESIRQTDQNPDTSRSESEVDPAYNKQTSYENGLTEQSGDHLDLSGSQVSDRHEIKSCSVDFSDHCSSTLTTSEQLSVTCDGQHLVGAGTLIYADVHQDNRARKMIRDELLHGHPCAHMSGHQNIDPCRYDHQSGTPPDPFVSSRFDDINSTKRGIQANSDNFFATPYVDERRHRSKSSEMSEETQARQDQVRHNEAFAAGFLSSVRGRPPCGGMLPNNPTACGFCRIPSPTSRCGIVQCDASGSSTSTRGSLRHHHRFATVNNPRRYAQKLLLYNIFVPRLCMQYGSIEQYLGLLFSQERVS